MKILTEEDYKEIDLSSTHNLIEINPFKIEIVQSDTGMMAKLQKKTSKAIWRPAPGRKLAFLVLHDNILIGLIFLASPVINLKVRDKYLNLPKNPSLKGKELRNYFDMSVCVAIQPLAWHWNVGKLCALLAPTLGDYIRERYDGCNFKGITTTSLWGKGSIYNRIYTFLGYSQGYGHFHITDKKYKSMIKWLKDNNYKVPSCKFGAGSNPRMRRISAYKKYSKDKSINFKHGQQRGVYYHPAIENAQREIIDYWYCRWGLTRYERTKDQKCPYLNGLDGESYEKKCANSQRNEI